jgi:hypothetical protein
VSDLRLFLDVENVERVIDGPLTYVVVLGAGPGTWPGTESGK